MSAIKRLYPKMLKSFPFKIDLLGLLFSGNMHNYIDRMIYLTGAHEKHMLYFLRDLIRILRKKCNYPITFMDVGANVGNHSLYLSTLVDKVYAFEPFDRVRQQFETNIKLNRISNIQIFPFGLSNEQAILPFYTGTEQNLGASSFVKDHVHDNQIYGVNAVKIGDDVIRQEQLQQITLLKIDVEGFEKNVLEGLQFTLQRDRPLIIIEMSATSFNTFHHNEINIRSVFPPNYQFYYFSYGNFNTGRYRLAQYNFMYHKKHQDIIAIPNEWLDIKHLLR